MIAYVFTMQTLIEWNVFQIPYSPGCWERLFSVPLAPLHSDRNPHPYHLSIDVWVCYVWNSATTSSCSNHLGSQVVIGYFLAAGRLTTGTGCNQCKLCAKTVMFILYLWILFETIH